jgi:regulator of protease activity HflC (stomatin/prohibitin superfamily)
MERSIQKNSLMNLLVLLAAGLAVLGTARFAGSEAGQVGAVFFGLGALISLAGWFHIRLVEREVLERMEMEELSRTRGQGSLFEGKDSEVFPARRSREQFEKWFIPVYTVVLLALQAAGAWLLWRWLDQAVAADLKRPMVAGGIWALCGLVLFIVGRFSVAFAREEANRLLRASAAYVLLGAYLCFALAAGVGFVEGGFKEADNILARALVVLLGLVALETLLALILELYRPRVRGRAVRPVYESRLVSLLGQPEGLVRTAAHTLDYQFGFKVSETWFYRFLEKALGGIILLQVTVLLLSTCVVFINPGEQAILLRFGKPVAGREVLDPGGHFTLPWPIDRVLRQATEQVQSFSIGRTPDPVSEQQVTRLWTVAHGAEENFLVPSKEETSAAATTGGTERPPPVNLLSVSIPVQFQITNLLAWSFTDRDPAGLLQSLATHETTKFLASVDFFDIMAVGRGAAAETLRDRIQAAAERRQIGVRILFVGLEGVHPPVKVAGDFAKLVGEMQRREGTLINAQAAAIRAQSEASVRADKLLNEALANRSRREAAALAQTARFTNQITAFNAAPSVYPQRLYLDTFVNATKGARKYLLLTTNTTEIIQMDLQDRIRTDLLEGLTAPTLDKK